MVPVVQLVEQQIVVLFVAGSSPVGHPILKMGAKAKMTQSLTISSVLLGMKCRTHWAKLTPVGPFSAQLNAQCSRATHAPVNRGKHPVCGPLRSPGIVCVPSLGLPVVGATSGALEGLREGRKGMGNEVDARPDQAAFLTPSKGDPIRGEGEG